MLLAALGLGEFGCHARDSPDTELPTAKLGARFRRLRRRIRSQVEDRERRVAALALVDQLQRELGEVEHLLIGWRSDLLLLPDEQRQDRGVALRVTRGYSERLGELAREVGRLGFALRCYVSPSEWPRVFPDGPEGPC